MRYERLLVCGARDVTADINLMIAGFTVSFG